MDINIIVAMGRNHVIGADGGMPWHLPADLRRFKSITMGYPIVMGRKTHASIGRALPGRTTIVVSRTASSNPDGCVLAATLDDAIDSAGNAEQLMIVGGARLYAEALPRAVRIYITEIDAAFAGDVYFPAFDRDAWHETSREPHTADEQNPYDYSFVVLERGRPNGSRTAEGTEKNAPS
jgi:dihydrofolate reductase